MNVKQMKGTLAAASEMYREAGADQMATALEAYSDLFEGYESKTVAAFVKQVERSKQANGE